MLVSGRYYLHLLDLPRCDFAQVCMHAQPCFRLARDSSPFASPGACDVWLLVMIFAEAATLRDWLLLLIAFQIH